MKSNIAYHQEDVDLLLVTMTFTLDKYRGPELRKRLDLLGYKIYPMDKIKMKVTDFVTQIGQANSANLNVLTIRRQYEIPADFDRHLPEARAHAEKYYHKVLADLQKIDDVLPQYWKI